MDNLVGCLELHVEELNDTPCQKENEVEVSIGLNNIKVNVII